MKHSIQILFILLISFNIQSQDRLSDSLILVKVYNDLDGANWENPENWISDLPLEDWEGITIDNNRVTKLELINQNPTGIFPETITQLDQLHTLEIRNGNVTGSIPATLVNLQKLVRFSVSFNNMSGDLPSIFDQFSDLTHLILQGNEFTGPLPDIGTKMNLIYLDRNNFSGPIPSSWENKSCRSVDISGNNLTGDFDLFSNYQLIYTITLSDNNWNESTFPSWIKDLTSLQRFSCEECNIVGEIPEDTDLTHLERYNFLSIADNDISGDLTLLLSNPENDEKLYLIASGNAFKGVLALDDYTHISRLIIDDNEYDTLVFTEELSMTNLNIRLNKFNFEDLSLLLDYLKEDSEVNILFSGQKSLLTPLSDTLYVSTQLTIEAGDNHPNTTYVWKKGNTTIQNEAESTLSLDISDSSDAGVYSCIMTNDSFPTTQLRRSEVSITVDFSTSTNEFLTEKTCIYPNPTADFINIKSNYLNYEIYNMQGMMIKNGTVANQNKIELGSYPRGTYMVILKNETQVSTHKITLI